MSFQIRLKTQDQKHDMEREIKTLHRRLRVGNARGPRKLRRRLRPEPQTRPVAQSHRAAGGRGRPLREGLAPCLTQMPLGRGVISWEEAS